MAAEAARAIKSTDSYIYGSAAPASAGYAEPEVKPSDSPVLEERVRARERARAEAAAQSAPSVSLFAVFGAVFAGFLMVFVVLAQINYNEVASEAVRYNTQYNDLIEQQRRLEITFESVIDMKEIERYARDVLGMSMPEPNQIAVVYSEPDDKVEILQGSGEESPLHGFGSFISSLFDHFKR